MGLIYPTYKYIDYSTLFEMVAVFLKSCRSAGLYWRKIVLTGNISVHVWHPDRHEVLFHNENLVFKQKRRKSLTKLYKDMYVQPTQ